MTATSSTPVRTEFCRSDSIWRMTFDLSWVKVTWTPSGHVACSASITFFTPSTVSIRLAPVRLDTSIVIAGMPLTRVTDVASLKVGRMVTTSPTVTAAPLEAAIGIFKTSCGRSIRLGTFTAKRPVEPSRAPAAIRLLDALKPTMSWSRGRL